MSLCLIPARGGSKRILRKNIRDFRGQPMIAWSIQAAQQSGCFERIVVSTDDEEIASISLSYGAEVPFRRPSRLSDDYSGTREVVVHAIDALGYSMSVGEDVCCIYATAPFLSAEILDNAKSLLDSSRPDTVVFAATSFPHPIQRSLTLDSEGYSMAMDPASMSMRSQDLVEAYHDAGQFYWATNQAWNGLGNLLEAARPLILPRWSVIDIDTEEDWRGAELMHAALFPGIEK
jgi:pseudaminic acid cytidylyltransferase